MDDRLAKYFYERNIMDRIQDAEEDIDLLQKLQTIKSVDLQTLPVPGDSTTPILNVIIDTDGTLAANSDERIASQRATKTYADAVSSNASVIAKILTGFAAAAGTVTAADSILSAFQKIVGKIAAMAVGHTIEDEGTPLTQRAKLNFVGGGITATDDVGDNASVVTVSAQTIGDLIEGSTNKATPIDADRFPLWDSVADILKYATWANVKTVLKAYFDTFYQAILTAATIGDFIVALTGKTTPVDADSILLSDSAASDDGKKVTWANVKATLKTYFDTLYQAVLTAANIGDFIVALTGKTTPVDADSLLLSDSAASDDGKKVTWANVKATLKTYFDTLYQAVLTAARIGDFIVALTAKTTPVDADSILLSDSAASDDGKKVTWANIKATLKTYFDTLYQAVLTAARIGDFIVALTAKTTPVDADSILLSDSAASDDGKKVTWANVKATLKSYFATFYRISSVLGRWSVVANSMTIGKDAGKVAAAIASGDTTVNFGQVMTVGDWVLFTGLEAGGSPETEWMLIGSLVSGTTYNVTRNVNGTGAFNWLIDMAFVVIGQDGDYFISIGAGTNASIHIVRQGATWNAWTSTVYMSDAAGPTNTPQVYTSGYLNSPYFLVTPSSVATDDALHGSYASGSFYLNGVFTASVSGTLTDYNPDSANKGIFQALRLNATAAVTLESLMYHYVTTFPGSTFGGRLVTIVNIGTFDITVKDNYTTGTDADSRFDLGGSDLVIPPDGSVIFWYDGTVEMWRVWGINQIVGDARFTNIQTLFTHGNNASVPASTTYFLSLASYGLSTTISNITAPACTARNLYLTTNSAQPGSGSLVVTLLKNGVATALTFTIAAGAAAATFSDTTHTVSVTDGDSLSVQVVNNATGASALITRSKMEIVY